MKAILVSSCLAALIASPIGRTQTVSAPAPSARPGLPALYILGDSTAAESPQAPTVQGWAVPFADYFDAAKIRVVNAARGGRSSRTFITQGLLAAVVADLKPGDLVLLQFGHNDVFPLNDNRVARGTLHGIGDETEEIDNQLTGQHEVVHTYGWYMRKMISDIRATGATPIVLTLTIRDRWNQNGTIGCPIRISTSATRTVSVNLQSTACGPSKSRNRWMCP